MFQSFEAEGDPSLGAERVARLREWLAANDLDGFLVPRADEHQGEYVAPRSERLRWLTGFSGSAGVALVLRDRAVLFVDGRYTLQVRAQTDNATFTYESLIDAPPASWMENNLAEGVRIGFDPWLHTISEVKALRMALAQVGGTLVAMEGNAVDAVWTDQPGPPLAPVGIHPAQFAGKLAKTKLARLAEKLRDQKATHFILTDPSSIAWAFNIRGGDVPHTPLALGFAILAADEEPALFLDGRKLPMQTKAYLTQLSALREPGELEGEITRLAAAGAKVATDPALAADKLRMWVENSGGTVLSMQDPARLPRAQKTQGEIEGARAAHRRDGAAVTRTLCWLDRQEAGAVDEIAAATKLEECRRITGEETQMPLRDISFDTISGAGPNGAIIHYRVTRETNRRLLSGELFLLDSGAQYEDGTTDITRTVAIGHPSEELRHRFTLVLRGMIALSAVRFPAGTRGCDLDAVPRLALWRAGLDYPHGTGHGVGSYLAVHEGPQRIARSGTQKLLAGMILSVEPGHYVEGSYGIRCENLILVTELGEVEGGSVPMHAFETLTLAPFDRRLIIPELLAPAEREWLDAYHARVLREIGPMLDGATLAWLESAAAPL